MSIWSSISVSSSCCSAVNLPVLCCSEGHGKLTVFSMKAMLATMCGGKIVDKLRCKYTCDEGQDWIILGPGRANLPWPFARSCSGEKRTHGGNAGTNIHRFILLYLLTLFPCFLKTIFDLLPFGCQINANIW